jgi:glycyl-tRNA synthetase beta chain
LFDRTQRMAQLAGRIASNVEADPALAQRAAHLSKCDLLTSMVAEFPELQGTMGKYYAEHDGEAPEVCRALEEQYLPRFAGDRLPETATGRSLALADKLDLIAGIFAIGQKPTGTRDPYGLRRAALGILRICSEARLDLDLRELVNHAVALQPFAAAEGVGEEIWLYIAERLRGTYLESDPAVTTEMFDAVLASQTSSPIDIDSRLQALKAFLALPPSISLANANKRIANILRKAGAIEGTQEVDRSKLIDAAEQTLYDHLVALEPSVTKAFAHRQYERALTELAQLKENVDAFFDSVMVMTEDAELRANRLVLLSKIRELFLRAADLSKLPG